MSSVLWGRALLALMAAATAAGAIAIATAWFQASGGATVGDQIPWVNVAVLGVVLAGAADAAGIAVARQRIAAARAELVDVVDDLVSRRTTTADGVEPVAARAMTWYHRPSCLLMRGKEATATGSHATARRRPCPVCDAADLIVA